MKRLDFIKYLGIAAAGTTVAGTAIKVLETIRDDFVKNMPTILLSANI